MRRAPTPARIPLAHGELLVWLCDEHAQLDKAALEKLLYEQGNTFHGPPLRRSVHSPSRTRTSLTVVIVSEWTA